MSAPTRLRGITWDHMRGYLPMVATAQRFSELHPEIEVVWEKRSLKAFGDQPLQDLAPHFDLLVIDHPFVGYAGASHPSYSYGGHHWALAIDAATPVSAWRPDLIEAPPETWEELVALARRGMVALPAVPIDSLMHVYMLCLALGEDPFGLPDAFAPERGAEALRLVRELVQICGPACLERNPIRTLEALVRGEAAYCPFAYGYSNYARSGYAAHLLAFGGLVSFAGRPLRSTLGGTGLAISTACQDREAALAYAAYVASPCCQRMLYTASGGQPGHRSAWLDAEANRLTHGYFTATLPTLDQSYLRPRYSGYLHFQDAAALLVHRFLVEGGDPAQVIAHMGQIYRESRAAAPRH
jgi:multiple sugar transport system substrate-binding protein